MQLNCILPLPKIYNIKRILEKQIIMEDIKPYEPKPQTWHHAGWLPMLVTCLVVGIAFSFGISYNNSTLKAKRAAEQAEIDAQKGIARYDKEGNAVLKLTEEKSSIGLEGNIIMTVKSARGTSSDLEVTVDTQNKFKGNIQNLDFSLIDIDQNGKEIKALEKATDLGEIVTNTAKSQANGNEKKIHFNYALGDHRQFLLYCTFAIKGLNLQSRIGVPFNLK